jgi:hypothetical protein
MPAGFSLVFAMPGRGRLPANRRHSLALRARITLHSESWRRILSPDTPPQTTLAESD